jgi:hypothetical protein
MHSWRTYEGPERFDCLSVGKVARWGQIRPQDALSLPQSSFDYEIVLHEARTSAISVRSLRLLYRVPSILAMEAATTEAPIWSCSRAG